MVPHIESHTSIKLNGPEASAPIEPVPLSPAPATTASPRQHDGRLTELLAQMKSKLGRILGPMAGFIFEEVVEEWQQLGAADNREIDRLHSRASTYLKELRELAKEQRDDA